MVDLANAVWRNRGHEGKVSFAPSDKLRNKAKEILGIDISEVFITASNVRHIKDSHGENENLRGQENIKPENFSELYDIINGFDEARVGKDDKLGHKSMVLSKDGEEVSFAIVSERGNSNAVVVTFYKRKKKKAPRMHDAQSPEHNVQNDSGRPPSSTASSIPQSQQKGNGKVGSFTIEKDGKKFTAGLDRIIDPESMENLSTLADSYGGTFKDGKYSFKTKKDRDAFLDLANAYIKLIEQVESSQASASSDKAQIRNAIRSMKIVKSDAITDQMNMLSTMGETMGCPVVWMDTASGLNGVYCGNVAFLNRNAGMDIQKTFWHEQFHWIKNNNEKLYGQLLSYFKGKSKFTKKQIDKYREDTARLSLSNDEVIEEMLADEFINVSKRVPMLQQMAKEKPALAKRFVAWIKRLMDRASEWFHNPDGKFTTAQRDTFVKAFGELAGSMKDSNGKPLFKTYNEGKRITLSNGDSLLSQLLDMVENPRKRQTICRVNSSPPI